MSDSLWIVEVLARNGSGWRIVEYPYATKEDALEEAKEVVCAFDAVFRIVEYRAVEKVNDKTTTQTRASNRSKAKRSKNSSRADRAGNGKASRRKARPA